MWNKIEHWSTGNLLEQAAMGSKETDWKICKNKNNSSKVGVVVTVSQAQIRESRVEHIDEIFLTSFIFKYRIKTFRDGHWIFTVQWLHFNLPKNHSNISHSSVKNEKKEKKKKKKSGFRELKNENNKDRRLLY